ncbi:hypothetical protein RPE78_04515 [Thioclava litoralis]|uniref:Uncharacterized protein n=1 Tax=Thioclava litoralis TaxID=3076557 RepID=A0ABZ1E3Y1_9RHOB|nr:hypothetical protein RPE78_04515 [Thioclava sp. FTW29]
MKRIVLSLCLALSGVTFGASMSVAQDAARNAKIAEILRANGMEFVTTDLKTLKFAEDTPVVQQDQPAPAAAQDSDGNS